MEKAHIFTVGQLYSALEIQSHLQVGNAGGIRVALDGKRSVRRLVLLTVVPQAKVERENPYHDRIEGDVLVYAGAGLQGDQDLGGANRRIVLQREEHFPIYGFRLNQSRRKSDAKRWEFLGLLQFLRHYPDTQIDRQGLIRKVWLFEFRVCAEAARVPVLNERSIMASALSSFAFDAGVETRVGGLSTAQAVSDERVQAEATERVRCKMLTLPPRDFELLVKAALEKGGFTDVVVTRYSQDGGIDVNAVVSSTHWPIAGLRLQVQAKRWLHTVGRREVAELRGSLEPFAHGAVVTTSYFSRAAISEAQAAGRAPVVLIDGYNFASTVKNHRLIPS